MADPIEELFVRLVADSRGFLQGVDAATDRAARNLDKVGQKARQVGERMRAAGMGLTQLMAPIIGVGVATTKLSFDFEESLSRIVGLVGVAQEQVDAWGKDILELGPKLGKSPRELAEALYFITSSGTKGAEAMDVLAASGKASAAGLGDISIIADAATSAMNAYGVGVITAEQATDVLVATVREGKGEATELAGALGRVIPIASNLGVSFDQVGAAIAVMTRSGLDASEAVTALRGIFTELLKGGGGAAAEALEAVGLTAEGLRRQLREEGLLALLKTLADRFQGNTDQLSQFIGNVRALSGFLNLTGQDAALVESVFASLAKSTGATEAAFSAWTDTAGSKWKRAIAAVQAELVKLGDTLGPLITEQFLPLLQKGTEFLGKFTAAFDKLPASVKTAIVSLVLFLAALGPIMIMLGTLIFTLGSVLPLLGGLGAAVSLALGPFGALVAILTAVAVAFALTTVKTEKLPPKLREVQGYLLPLREGVEGLVKAGRELSAMLADAAEALGGFLSKLSLGTGINGTTAAIVALSGALLGLLLALNPLTLAIIGVGGVVFAIGLFRSDVETLPAPLLALRRELDLAALGFLDLADAILQVADLEFGPIDLTPWETSIDLAREKVAEARAGILSDLDAVQYGFDSLSADRVVAEVQRLTGVIIEVGNASVISVARLAELTGKTEAEAARILARQYGPAAKRETLAQELARRFGIGAKVTPPPGAGGGGATAEAREQVTAYTESLDELTETLVGLGRASGMTDRELAGFPWTLDLARRAADRLGLSTDDLLDIFRRTREGFGDFMRALAASEALDNLKKITDAVVGSLADLRSQFEGLFGAPTREQAAINYQLAQLKLRRAQMVAVGATDEALAGIDREIARIETINELRDAEADVMRAQLDLADKTLLTDAERFARARDLIGQMAELSAAAVPVIQLYRDQEEAMRGWMDSLAGLLFALAAVPLPTAQIPSMQSGGIVPGARGSPQLLLAHGGEYVLPMNAGLNFSIPVSINIAAGADWMEISRRAHEAVTEALHQARSRSYLQGAPLGSAIG
ncbi:MAG: phage tail tape measure protein [Elusimicrobia bacterium RBG_16_66_12]|nr:MAG: phage tail tape measure protein [Elusimicrobia bacterium RBG_16_66_12]